MHLIVCLDQKQGMLFGGRRQSMDRVLRQRVADLCAGKCPHMNEYSAKQFQDIYPNIQPDADFLLSAKQGEYCFVENTDVMPYLDRVEDLIVYRWNRAYPSDVTFPLARFTCNRALVRSTDFRGSSHECITEEVYRL